MTSIKKAVRHGARTRLSTHVLLQLRSRLSDDWLPSPVQVLCNKKAWVMAARTRECENVIVEYEYMLETGVRFGARTAPCSE